MNFLIRWRKSYSESAAERYGNCTLKIIDGAGHGFNKENYSIGGSYDNKVWEFIDEYLEHLKSTEQFAEAHTNYMLKKTSAHAFRNLQIIIHEGKWAMISKGKAPSIHFVVHHPKLLNAIESFIPPVVESEA